MSRLTEPPPPLDGEIRFDGRARAAAAEDFGHLVHRSPEVSCSRRRTRTWQPLSARPPGRAAGSLAKELSGNGPAAATLLASLSDDRPRAQPSTLLYLDHLTRFTALEQALRSSGQWWLPHPWLTTFVGDSTVESVVTGELAELTPADLGPLGQVVISAVLREACDWRTHFGAAFRQLSDAKHEHDPGHVLTPGYEVF